MYMHTFGQKYHVKVLQYISDTFTNKLKINI